MDKSNIIVVTGATGHQGGAVARELLSRGYKVRAVTRHPDKEQAKELRNRGAEIIKADFDDTTSMEKALKGAWGIFAVQNSWEAGVQHEVEQGKRMARMAKDAGIQYYVYTSVGAADQDTGIPHFDSKFQIENTVREMKFPSYTIIRPVFFMENFLSPMFKQGLEQGKLMIALKPETELQMIAVEDIGKYGRWAFENHENLNGRAFDIAGDALTMPEIARTIGNITGKKVEFVQVPIEKVRESSSEYAMMLDWFNEVGYDADIEGMSKESGIRVARFEQWAKHIKWHVGVAVNR